VKGREGPPLGNIWLAWDTTVTCDADHVICCEICAFCSGKHWNASKTPRHVGISRGPGRPLPDGSHFVIISLCDVDHNFFLQKGDRRRSRPRLSTIDQPRMAMPSHRYEYRRSAPASSPVPNPQTWWVGPGPPLPARPRMETVMDSCRCVPRRTRPQRCG
jgi:hypothetical protein